MRNKIQIVNIYIGQYNGLSRAEREREKTPNDAVPTSTYGNREDLGIYPKDKAPNGVYIVTESGYCILPEYYGLYKMNTPVGIGIIKGKHSLLVSLNGSKEEIILSKDTNSYKTDKQYDCIEKALNDWDGKENTKQLAKSESPAAKYCLEYECGSIKKGSWWIASFGEKNLMFEHKTMVDACLAICGGEVLHGYWYWSSTEHSKGYNWVLDWNDGSRGYDYQDVFNRVRPVSAFL